jgi:predicted RNA-binding Zn-ribbon protein involved in translation (DUF1610 family)
MSDLETEERPVESAGADALAPGAQPDAVVKEANLYDRFTELAKDIFEHGEQRSHEALDKAMETARKQLSAAGEFTGEQGEAFKRYLLRDLDQRKADARQLGEKAIERLHPARVGAGAMASVARILQNWSSALTSLSEKAGEALVYRTGEITMAGTLTCASCGHQVRLTKTSVVPSCPECQGTQFRRGY